ncbi:MAG: DUF3253 domain-containing protein [Pseudorhodobacter sp.]
MTGAEPFDEVIRAAILDHALRRAPKTLCPSEVARALSPDWRPLMPHVRAVAAGMAEVEILQKGAPVPDPAACRGPVRLRLSAARE